MYHWKPRFDFQDPPGTYEQELPHPGGENEQIKIGVSHEHRFAFYFWARWIEQQKEKSQNNPPPDLVTIDWHRDLATPTEQEKEDLESLELTDSNELSLFCWGYLNPHNDDHVLSAAYRNIIGDIYVLCKQKFTNPNQITDFEGKIHNITVIQEPDTLVDKLHKTHQLYLDIDLDYFTETDSFMGMDADVELVSSEEVRALIDPSSPLFQEIFSKLNGMTLALEPNFCGGYRNSCNLFKIIDEQLFNPALLNPAANWKHLD